MRTNDNSKGTMSIGRRFWILIKQWLQKYKMKGVKKTRDSRVGDCTRRMRDIIEEVVPLYGYIEQMIFAPIDIDVVRHFGQLWMPDAGRSAESGITAVLFEKFVRAMEAPNNATLNKMLYWYDIEAWLNAVQDRLDSTIWMLEEFYSTLPSDTRTSDEQIAGAAFSSGDDGRKCYVAANTIFINLASVFDILAKIACELECFSTYNFSKYPNIKSASKIYKNNLQVSAVLRQQGMLFETPELPIVRKIETLRNEYVHNGPWDRQPNIYYPVDANGMPLPAFMLMPDMTATGTFVTVRNRNKFYADGKRLNEELMPLVNEALDVVEKTLEGIKEVAVAQTAQGEDKEGTQSAIEAICGVVEEVCNIMKKEAE